MRPPSLSPSFPIRNGDANPLSRKYVAKASKIVFDLAVKARLTQPWTDIESGSRDSALPGGARAEAERRRFVLSPCPSFEHR